MRTMSASANRRKGEKAYRQSRMIEADGLRISVTPAEMRITSLVSVPADLYYTVEIWRGGVPITANSFRVIDGWRERLSHVDHAECGLRVIAPDLTVVAVLDIELDPFPFMKLRPGEEQRHITENYVAVPPALTILDERGAVWTLGLATAPEWQSPAGEFAFEVLRDGVGTGEIASRIERRQGKIRIFTHRGWKVWTGESFF